MNILKKFSRNLKSLIRNDRNAEIPGFLGNLSGAVKADERGNVYVTLFNGEVRTVYNGKVPNVSRLPVVIGYGGAEKMQVLRSRDVYPTAPYPDIPTHGSMHTFPGPDAVPIRGEQFLPGLVIPISGLTVKIYSLPYELADGWHVLATQTLDLTSSVPSTGAKYARLEADDTGAVTISLGTAVDTRGELEYSDIPDADPDKFSLAAVKLYAGQTSLIYLPTDTDIIDLRFGKLGGGGGGGAPSGAAGGELAGTYPNPTLSNASVISKVLTGFSASAGTVSATDSILQAFQKIVGNIALKLTANTAITGATKTKITYDANGLVTAGADLSASDIPNLDASKITSGTIDAARLPTPTTTALGGVKRNTGSAGQFVKGIDSAGALEYDTPAGGGDWVLIADSVLGSDAANFDFTSIPSTYKHLKLVYSLRSDRAAASDRLKVVINNDTGSSKYETILYYWYHTSTWGTIDHGVTTYAACTFFCGNTALANSFGGGFIEFNDYKNTTNLKLFQTRGGQLQSTTVKPEIYDGMSVWRDTAAINRITISPIYGTNFKANSRATLYGQK